MSQNKIIILDFDGTLGDTAEIIVRTMQATSNELELPARTNEQCTAMIGLRLVDIPRTLYPECDVADTLYAETYRRLFYELNTEGAVTLYPQVKETLNTLKAKGIILTLASSRSHSSLAQYVDELELSDLISYILGADDVQHGKPNAEPVEKILKIFRIKPEEAIVVGDTEFDIRMGKNAGTRTCGVTYGNGTRESLNEADHIIDRFDQLLQIL